MNKDLYLPVSIGEALDKLTILDIKLEFIKDNRRNLVQIEYDALYEKLQFYVDNNNEYYKLLKQVNLDIWYMMDILRDSNITDDKYIIQCKECIEANDMRFRIKNKINISSNSLLKEQKGYNVLRVIFDLNDMNADINEINTMMRDPDKYCKIWRDFQTTKQPKYWVVWPYSKSKGWCDRITGQLNIG
jgi:hypothetical protein